MTKQFHLGDVLSVSHEMLVSPRHMDGVYDILNHMTGDNLFTHQLPRAARECKPNLLTQHPWLAEITTEDLSDRLESAEDRAAVCAAWLAEQVAKYGEMFDIAPIPSRSHAQIDSLTELQQMRGDGAGVIVVSV